MDSTDVFELLALERVEQLAEAGALGMRERLDDVGLGSGAWQTLFEQVGELEQAHACKRGEGRSLAGLRHGIRGPGC